MASAEFSAIGEAVNLAARLQAEAPAGSAVVSQETARLVEGRFTFEDLGTSSHQGPFAQNRHLQGDRAHPHGGPRRNAFGIRSDADRWTPAERRSHASIDGGSRAKKGAARRSSIVGDAGIGKTRSCVSFAAMPELAETTILQANCHELFSNTPLYPLVSFLWARIGLDARRRRRHPICRRYRRFSTNWRSTPTRTTRSLPVSWVSCRCGAVELVAPTPLLLKQKAVRLCHQILIRLAASTQPTASLGGGCALA